MIGLYDLKSSFNNLRKDYSFSAAVVATLALTLGISLFLFTMLYSIEYKPLPKVPQSQQVAWGTLFTSGRAYAIGGLSNYNVHYLQQHQKSLQDLGRIEQRGVTLSNDQFTEQTRGAAVSGNMFTALAIEAQLGQTLQDSDDLPGSQRRVVISHELWKTLFNQSPNVLGQSVKLEGQVAEIIGVMPENFRFPLDHDIWFTDPSIDQTVNDHGGWNSIYGRLKPGVTMAEADAEIKRLMAEMIKVFPNEYKGKDLEIISFTKRFSENRAFLLVLLKIAALAILIMGCFSVSNLIIVRNLEKSREVLIKTALGVPVSRIVSALLLETFWLCLAALILGTWLCYLVITFLGKDVLGGPYWWQLEFQWPIFICAVITTLLLWLATSLVPVWMASRQPTNALLSSGRKGASGNRLVALMFGFSTIQIFSAFILAVFTGVLVMGLLRVATADYGVPREGYLTASVKLAGEKYAELEQRVDYYRRFVEAAQQVPGISKVGVITAPPGSGGFLSTYNATDRDIEISGGYPKTNETPANITYFDVMEIELLEGRYFNAADAAGAEEVAIINRTMAEILFPGESAIGRQFQYDPEKGGHLITVVGVVPDVVSNNPLWYFSPASQDWRSQLYRPIAQKQPIWSPNTLMIKTEGNPYDYVSQVKTIAREIDAEIPLYRIMSYDDFLAFNEQGFRRMIFTFAPAALLALLIAALGLFSITRRVTLQNLPDIGIMRAIGVPERVINLKYLRASLLQIVLALAAGSVFSTLLLPSLPSNILITDTQTTIIVCILCTLAVGIFAFAASYIPVLKTRNIQPREAIQYLTVSAD